MLTKWPKMAKQAVFQSHNLIEHSEPPVDFPPTSQWCLQSCNHSIIQHHKIVHRALQYDMFQRFSSPLTICFSDISRYLITDERRHELRQHTHTQGQIHNPRSASSIWRSLIERRGIIYECSFFPRLCETERERMHMFTRTKPSEASPIQPQQNIETWSRHAFIQRPYCQHQMQTQSHHNSQIIGG